MKGRMLLAAALSFLVLIAYPRIISRFYPDFDKVPVSPVSVVSSPQGLQNQKTIDSQGFVSTSLLLDRSKSTPFNTNLLSLTLHPLGGVIQSIGFDRYPDPSTGKSRIVIDSDSGDEAVLAMNLRMNGKEVGPIPFESSQNSSSVIFKSTTSDKLKISKTLGISNSSYFIDLSIDFENVSNEDLSVSYEMLAGTSFISHTTIDGQYIEANLFENGKIFHQKDTKKGKEVVSESAPDWVAVKDRHFAVILVPDHKEKYKGFVRGLEKHRFSAGLQSVQIVIPAHSSEQEHFKVYAGPVLYDELQPYHLTPIVHFGKLDGICKLLLGALDWISSFTHNYGVGIILLTVSINLLLFPLTRQSLLAAKRMQEVQPHVTKLREIHKNNPQKLNKEMMDVYKRHRVNPLGGCLPMVIQLPVFISLYVALSKSVQLVNSKLLWIKDLSRPDDVTLPLTLPFIGNTLHILPIVMVAAMAVQQKNSMMSTEGQDPQMQMQQKMMGVMMPIVFGFVFYPMPSGLVLYWLTNTLMMIFYQFHLKKS